MKMWHRMGLRAQLMVGFLVVYVMVVLFMTHSLSQWSMEKLHASQGQLLTQLAQQMSRALDKDMYERYREISNLARLPLMSRQDITAEMRRDHFNRLKATHSYYAWIGQTDADGNILIGTDGLLEGKNVAKRDWFVEGRAGMHVGDVHDAFLLAKLLPKPANDPLPLRLVDVSAPIVSAEGSVLGVLCGHLGWHWAIDVRSQLLAPLGEDRQIDILVLNREGKVLLGTPELLPSSEGLAMTSVRQAVGGRPATLVDVWPDGQAYLTAAAVSTGFEDYPGLGWIVMVRQPVEVAFADADAMVGQVWQLSLLGSLLVLLWLGWLAGKVTRPVVAMTQAAEDIAHGGQAVRLPVWHGEDEAARLSRALNGMMQRLLDQQQSLEASHADLAQELDRVRVLESEARIYAVVFGQSVEGLVVTDAQAIIQLVNPAFSRITGYSAQEVIGKPISLLASQQHDRAFYDAMWGALSTDGRWEGRVVNRRKDGRLYEERLIINALRDEQGQVSHYVGLFLESDQSSGQV